MRPRLPWLSACSMPAVMFVITMSLPRATPVAACEPEPITPNTPTGIAGCWREGEGIASHYGPGHGVAMNWCTWEVHRGHSQACGSATITSLETGVTVTAPVIDFCDCYTGTADERIIDLQYGVVDALGLDRSRGLYPVIVTIGASQDPRPADAGNDAHKTESQPEGTPAGDVGAPLLPNTSMTP